MAEDLHLSHAREFTDIENVTLRIWFDLDQAGLEREAAEVLDTGLMFEHFTSLLPSDPSMRTPEQMTTQRRLQLLLDDAIRRGREALSAHHPNVPAREWPSFKYYQGLVERGG